ncbi:hypothetical protein K3495_g10361 [Podosphaera aphanis]|nr:hypothetical protein K3495_g10361 [Podosphaera aphanis]
MNPLMLPPWEISELDHDVLNRVHGPISTPNTWADIFRDFLHTIPRSDIQVYSDGSRLPDGNAGGGFVIFQLGRIIQTKAFPLGKGKEIYDAEANAALRGIQAALALSTTRFSNNLWVFIDNFEVAKKLSKLATTTSSQEIFIDALEAVKQWKARTRLSHINEGETMVL